MQTLLGRGTALQPGKAPGHTDQAALCVCEWRPGTKRKSAPGPGGDRPRGSVFVPSRPDTKSPEALQPGRCAGQSPFGSAGGGEWPPWPLRSTEQEPEGRTAETWRAPGPAPGREVAPSVRGLGRPWWRGVRRRVQCG